MLTRALTTWEDVLRMPDDGNRYEFIGGRLYMTPAPVTIDLDKVFSRHLDQWENGT